MGDELLRRRLEAMRLRGPDPAMSPRAQRFKVINGGNLPTAVPRVFWCVPVGPVIGGSTPAEGGSIASSALADTEAQPVVVIGPEAPTLGKELLAWRINDQWVADYGGEGAVSGPTVQMCTACYIPTSKSLYATFAPGDNRPSWLGIGTYPLTYSPTGETCYPGFPWPEGWYYKTAGMLVAFHKSCGLAVCAIGSVTFGVGASGPAHVDSCDPVLIRIGGILLSGTIHE